MKTLEAGLAQVVSRFNRLRSELFLEYSVKAGLSLSIHINCIFQGSLPEHVSTDVIIRDCLDTSCKDYLHPQNVTS